MQYILEERIGDPFLFCGREKEMSLLLDWISRIPKKISKSKAILGRRKSGKTAIMQRLFNILWSQNGQVIPFYFEVMDQNQWILQFADEYFRTFLSQYLSFEKRIPLESDNAPFEWETILVQKIDVFKHTLKRMEHQEIYLLPVYLSANGFNDSSEKWLHEQNVFTADMNTWKINSL